MELLLVWGNYYRVKKGQTLLAVAKAFGVPASVLSRRNRLKEELFAGQIIEVPKDRRNLYVVRGGESKTLLCGSVQNFEARNGTRKLYPTQTVWL